MEGMRGGREPHDTRQREGVREGTLRREIRERKRKSESEKTREITFSDSRVFISNTSNTNNTNNLACELLKCRRFLSA